MLLLTVPPPSPDYFFLGLASSSCAHIHQTILTTSASSFIFYINTCIETLYQKFSPINALNAKALCRLVPVVVIGPKVNTIMVQASGMYVPMTKRTRAKKKKDRNRAIKVRSREVLIIRSRGSVTARNFFLSSRLLFRTVKRNFLSITWCCGQDWLLNTILWTKFLLKFYSPINAELLRTSLTLV